MAMRNTLISFFFKKEAQKILEKYPKLSFYSRHLRMKEPMSGGQNSHEKRLEKVEEGSEFYSLLWNFEDLEGKKMMEDKGSIFLNSSLFSNHNFIWKLDEPGFSRIFQIRRSYYFFLGFIFLISLLFAFWILRGLLLPLNNLSASFVDLLRGNFNTKTRISGQDEIAMMGEEFNKMVAEIEEKQKMAPFVPEVVRLVHQRFQIRGGALRGEGVVVFSDIRSFTTISENYEPEEIVSMLNGYFSIWQPVVEKYCGVIDRFIGDAVSVVFLKELAPDFIQNAVNCAFEVMQEVEKFNQQRNDSGLFTIANGIGIAFSDVVFTVVGNEEKLEFFIQGEAAQIAEVLEAESKRGQHTKIIVQEQIALFCSGFEWVFFDTKEGKGPCFELVQKLKTGERNQALAE